MNGVDILGIENVCNFMRSAKKSKFSIYRSGQNPSAIPVFESLENDTYNNAIQDFETWAGVVNNAQVYKMILFNYIDGENEAGQPRKTKGRTGKNEIFFVINPGAGQPVEQRDKFGRISGPEMYQQRGPSLEEIKSQVIQQLAAEQEKSATLKALETITARLEALEIANNEDEDEDEDEGGLFGNSSQLASLLKLLPMLNKGQAPQPSPTNAPVLNGPVTAEAETKEQKIETLNSAIKRLYAVNNRLHHDLTILANLAENDAETFNFLISQLRNMNK